MKITKNTQEREIGHNALLVGCSFEQVEARDEIDRKYTTAGSSKLTGKTKQNKQ